MFSIFSFDQNWFVFVAKGDLTDCPLDMQLSTYTRLQLKLQKDVHGRPSENGVDWW